jgi:prepilin-type N-terminal cleavage/methylation domain-containing protein
MRARARSPSAGFTLVELLVTMGIITLLAAALLPALGRIRVRVQRGHAWSQIQLLATALSQYESDVRHLPRLTARRLPDVFQDDAPALYAALANEPTPQAGGGPSAPYPKGSLRIGRLVDRRRLDPATMGQDGVTGVVELGDGERPLAASLAFQVDHAPTSAEPLVYVDPWGGPYHYREWDTVPAALVRGIVAAPPARTGFVASPEVGEAPIAGPVRDLPRQRYQVWSNGPNGVNEFGEGDDVASWRAP